MTAHVSNCQACGASVSGEVYHLGFSDMSALYCSTCPEVLLLKDWELLEQRGIRFPSTDITSPEAQPYCRHFLPTFAQVENLFRACQCGGRFGFMNPMRCPKCLGLFVGNRYEDKPIFKLNDRYVFVTAGSIADRDALADGV